MKISAVFKKLYKLAEVFNFILTYLTKYGILFLVEELRLSFLTSMKSKYCRYRIQEVDIRSYSEKMIGTNTIYSL